MEGPAPLPAAVRLRGRRERPDDSQLRGEEAIRRHARHGHHGGYLRHSTEQMRPEEVRKAEAQMRPDTGWAFGAILVCESSSVSVNQLGSMNDAFACGRRRGCDSVRCKGIQTAKGFDFESTTEFQPEC
jgi:hypothetical protein